MLMQFWASVYPERIYLIVPIYSMMPEPNIIFKCVEVEFLYSIQWMNTKFGMNDMSEYSNFRDDGY